MRTIDADALKQAIRTPNDKRYLSESIISLVFERIDNAPTVETDIEVVAKDAYEQGYTDGWKERFGEPDKRLQGEWVKVVNKISECETETHWECSECHNPDFRLGEAEFCSFCGASMKGGTE